MKLPVTPPIAPMLAKLTRDLPRENGLYYEPKWDGFRCIVFRDGDEVELGSRNEKPLTRYFPELVDALRRELPERIVLDGEIVIAGTTGLDFDALSQRIHPAAKRINQLAAEEQRLEEAHVGEGLSDDELTRKRELEITLDEMWDLLRQRRAKRNAGQDPETAEQRSAGTVEGYLQ